MNGVTNADDSQSRTRSKSLDIYVANHQSHFDYMGIVSDLYPHLRNIKVASGDNLRFGLIGFLIQHSFAFFVSRSYRKQAVPYKKAFLRYLEKLVVARNPILVFMEGGRSRNGRMRPSQTGLVYMLLHEALRNHFSELVFHPITVSYDVVPEGRSLLQEKSKVPESTWRSLRGFLSFLSGPRLNAYRHYGDPIKVVIDRDFQLEKATMKVCEELKFAILTSGFFNFGGFLFHALRDGKISLNECYLQWLELHPFFINKLQFSDAIQLRIHLDANFGRQGLIMFEPDNTLSLTDLGRKVLQYSGDYFAESLEAMKQSRQNDKQRGIVC